MKKEDLLYKLTGTETPMFISKRENVIIDKCLNLINDLESVVKNLTIPDVIKSGCPACGSKYYDEDNNVKQCQDCYTVY